MQEELGCAIYNIKGPLGLCGTWFNFATAKGDAVPATQTKPASTFPAADGYAFGFRHQRFEWHGGCQTFSVQYGTGAASNFSTSIDDPSPLIRTTARLLVTEHLLFQPNERFAVMPIFIYQRTKDYNVSRSWNQWV